MSSDKNTKGGDALNIADIFNNATAITRGGAEHMATGWKCYKDKVAIKHETLQGGDKVLVKITDNAVIFTKNDKGNRTLTSKGADGRVMLSLNAQMKKVLAETFNLNKNGGECATLELETQEQGGATYYILRASAEQVAND